MKAAHASACQKNYDILWTGWGGRVAPHDLWFLIAKKSIYRILISPGCCHLARNRLGTRTLSSLRCLFFLKPCSLVLLILGAFKKKCKWSKTFVLLTFLRGMKCKSLCVPGQAWSFLFVVDSWVLLLFSRLSFKMVWLSHRRLVLLQRSITDVG